MRSPKDKYMNDPKYHHFVQLMEDLIERADFTPSELREMCILACIHYEMRHVRERAIEMDRRVTNAFLVLEEYVDNPRRQLKSRKVK